VIKNIISGAFIGVANIIPGVSGGTVALLLGVYEKLTESVGEFFTVPKEKKIEFIKFLSQIFIGVVIGLLVFARVIGFLYSNYREGTSFFFLGLIVASLPLVLTHRESKQINKYGKLWFLFGLFIMIGFIVLQSFYGNGETSSGLYKLTGGYIIKLILAGAMAGGAMVIPGISGSLLLVMLGEYYNILGFVNNRMILPVALVGFGAVIGIVGFARIIDKLLKSHRDNTLYFIIGLIVASLVEIWPGFTLTLPCALTNIIIFVLGIYIVKLMRKLEGNK
jgi:putative membrane protein